jgi:hypothetical protein
MELSLSPNISAIAQENKAMRNFPAAVLVLCLTLLVMGSVFAARPNAQSAATAGGKAVIVELFTSEGCSSCPPADALLQKLEARQPVAGATIVGLEEHVDYWNHDGWRDPFSSSQWTQRQLDYGAKFQNDAYTPQMVVNGESQFVGNNGQEAELEIEKAARRVKADVAIASEASNAARGPRFSVTVGKVTGIQNGDVAEVWLAVSEDSLHSSVSRGENAGRELRHIATLRSLQKIGIANAGGASLSFRADRDITISPDWVPANLHVVVFVQMKKSREILGAASTKIRS